MKRDIEWCLKLSDGLKITEPNENLSKSYLLEAKSSVERAEKNFKDGDLLWATVVIYYAEYYALYAFLQKIGLKCENHFCSILAATKILGEEKTKIINEHKNNKNSLLASIHGLKPVVLRCSLYPRVFEL